MSYLLQKWSGTRCVKELYTPSVNCLENMVAAAADHAQVYFNEQEPVDPITQEEILVATGDCKGVPMRRARSLSTTGPAPSGRD